MVIPSEPGTATTFTSSGLLRRADFSAVTEASAPAAGVARIEPLTPRTVITWPGRRVPFHEKSARWAEAGAAPHPAAIAATRNHMGIRMGISTGADRVVSARP